MSHSIMKFSKIALAAGWAMLGATEALAGETPAAGSWALVITIEQGRAITSMSRITSISRTICLTADGLKSPEMGLAPKSADLVGACHRTTLRKTDEGLRWRFACGDGDLPAEGFVRFDSAKHFTGVTQMSSSSKDHPLNIIKKTDGHWTGECKP
jgi:hypothetical protein